MALTTHEKIRTEAGFQSQFTRQTFKNSPNGTDTTFYVDSDDNVKFVPNFGTGTTIAGISDVQVWLGLSGVYGVSRLGISAIDIDQGSVQLNVIPASGSSLTVSYASSALSSLQIEDKRKEAEAIINTRLAICYDLPISPTPSRLESLATRLSAALLLIRGYGNASRNRAGDGYKLYEVLMGDQEALLNRGTDAESTRVGEVGMICSPNYQLIDDDGNIIPRTDQEVTANDSYTVGGRNEGRLYDITEEAFRKKEWQSVVDRDQPGSGL